MSLATVHVTRVGHAVVQDLGRPGYAALGLGLNGASDRRAARTASALVGNPDVAAFVETLASDLTFVADVDLLIAVTGAASRVIVDGHDQPSWETLELPAGTNVTIPYDGLGLRSYLAVNGLTRASRALGSVAPDPLLGVGRRLRTGDTLVVESQFHCLPHDSHLPLYRFGARRPCLQGSALIDAVPGPDLDRLATGPSPLSGPFEISGQSDHVGLRLVGPDVRLSRGEEILSRGVPVGAIEVIPSGGLIILLRGRLLTAGYPVVAVVTTACLDRLGQARPGDQVRINLTDVSAAVKALRKEEDEHQHLAERVRRALRARGLGSVLQDRESTLGYRSRGKVST